MAQWKKSGDSCPLCHQETEVLFGVMGSYDGVCSSERCWRCGWDLESDGQKKGNKTKYSRLVQMTRAILAHSNATGYESIHEHGMRHTKFFTVVEDDAEGKAANVLPSEYLKTLQPREAIAKLKAHIGSLNDDLWQYRHEDLEKAENFLKVRMLAFELKIVQEYHTHLIKAYETELPQD